MNAYNSNRSTVPEPIVLYYGYEMLSILATLHQCGFVHADVKPDNFMLKDLRYNNTCLSMTLYVSFFSLALVDNVMNYLSS